MRTADHRADTGRGAPAGLTGDHRGGHGRRPVRHAGAAADLAYSTPLLEATHAKRLARDGEGLLRGRILELIRIRSAQLRFLDLLSADHHAIDAEFYRELGEVFTTAQILELGFSCAETMGLHRFIHTSDIFGTDPPVLSFSPDQIDARHRSTPVEGAGGQRG